MGGANQVISGPDFREGLSVTSLKSGEKLLGHVDGEPVLLIKRGELFFAIGTVCTHYSGNLAEGTLTEGTVHCPWHHACFDIETGEATKAPALNPIPTWRTEIRGEKVYVQEKREYVERKRNGSKKLNFVILGSGAAGHAAAEMLRRSGYDGALTLLTEDAFLPYDRPNLSKDYLAGSAPEEWMLLRQQDFYESQNIEIKLKAKVSKLDTQKKVISLSSGEELHYDKCLLAPGGAPVRPKIEGLDLPHVHFLRSFADCQRLIQDLAGKKKVLIVGSGFIGLEAAAALKTRGLEVTVVSPQEVPLAHVVGSQVGAFLKSVHESKGVRFCMNQSVVKITPQGVEFKDGARREAADLVLVATGISPNVALAQSAGLKCEDGILVNEFLETSSKDVFAAGDAARWPEVASGKTIRVEHWVVAQRLGQVAALNMLGQNKKFQEVPFFWSQQFDLAFGYVGHTKSWTSLEIHGSLEARDCTVAFFEGERIAAVLTIGRDYQNLQIEKAMEDQNQSTLKKIIQSSP